MTNIKYSENCKIAEFNGKRYVKDEKTGYYLCHDAIGSGSRLHRDVWKYYNCEIPKGYEVHHKDHDKDNNDISNLQLMKKSEHSRLHGEELTEEEREWRRKNLIKNARPVASEWHKSEEGRAWHREMSKKAWEEKKPITYKCDYCGKEFETINSYSEKINKFCSNACRSAYRRKIGADDVEKVCENCGKTFISNKYLKRRYCCKSCAAYGRNKARKGET